MNNKARSKADAAFAEAYRQVYHEAAKHGLILDADMQRVRTAANAAGRKAYREALEQEDTP